MGYTLAVNQTQDNTTLFVVEGFKDKEVNESDIENLINDFLSRYYSRGFVYVKRINTPYPHHCEWNAEVSSINEECTYHLTWSWIKSYNVNEL